MELSSIHVTRWDDGSPRIHLVSDAFNTLLIGFMQQGDSRRAC
jgi:hypothetical protein